MSHIVWHPRFVSTGGTRKRGGKVRTFLDVIGDAWDTACDGVEVVVTFLAAVPEFPLPAHVRQTVDLLSAPTRRPLPARNPMEN